MILDISIQASVGPFMKYSHIPILSHWFCKDLDVLLSSPHLSIQYLSIWTNSAPYKDPTTFTFFLHHSSDPLI